MLLLIVVVLVVLSTDLGLGLGPDPVPFIIPRNPTFNIRVGDYLRHIGVGLGDPFVPHRAITQDEIDYFVNLIGEPSRNTVMRYLTRLRVVIVP